MEEMTLVIDKSDCTVSLRGKALVVKNATEPAVTVPMGCLGSVIIVGRPSVTCDVWRALADENIPATLIAGRGKKPAAILGASLEAGLDARRRQYKVYEDADSRLETACKIVSIKFEAYQSTLDVSCELIQLPYPIDIKASEKFRSVLNGATQKLSDATEINRVLGLEGAVSRAWFSLIRGCVDAKWGFESRNRRPPRDPLNALLSLTYTLISAKANQAVQVKGLDPRLGFLHSHRSGRPALALDVMEPLRPTADLFCLLLLEEFDEDQFHCDELNGCSLSKTGRSEYFNAWARHQHNWIYAGPIDLCQNESVIEVRTKPLNSQLNEVIERVMNTIETLCPEL